MPAEMGTELVLALRDANEDTLCTVGQKAATLGRLSEAGFAIPEGLVLGAQAFAQSADAADPFAPDAVLPVRVEKAIAAIAAYFDGVTLAVRSSAIDEDQPNVSFAGQYDTVLGVRGIRELRAAVLRCWASASGSRVLAYRSQTATPAGVAVLVQRQLVPDVAGVAFTADPVTGDRDKVLVSAVPGLGDALVSGEVTGDEWTVIGESATPTLVRHQALTAGQAVAVSVLARRVEAFLGGPQDIEWAMDSGRLILLQARPITALPRPPEVSLPHGTWFKETDRYAEPMTAFGAPLAAGVVSHGLSTMFAEYGSLIDRVDCRSIGGEMYLRISPIGARPGSGPPPWFMLAVLVRTVPALRARMRAAARRAGPAQLSAMVTRWYDEWRPQLREDIGRLRLVALSDLSAAELAAHFTAVRNLLERAMLLHFRLIPAHAVPLYTLAMTCRRVLGWDAAQTLDLLAGVSVATTEPARAMAGLAAAVRRRPELVAALRAGSDPASALRAESVDLATAFDDWCDRYAYRCVSDDPGSATLAEQPQLMRRLLLDTADPAERMRAAERIQRAAREKAHRELGHRSARAGRQFATALEDAVGSYGLREDVALWTGSMGGGLARTAAIEAGRRLVADGRIDRAVDAVQLDPETLTSALTGRTVELREKIAVAKAERAWVRHHPGPAFYGPAPTPPPDLRGLPRVARTLNAATLWARSGNDGDLVARAGSDEVLRGVAGSPGRHTGPVRLVMNEADFPRLLPGDVLVTNTTDPAWSVLFGIAGALVTNGGGLLSHAAIVAREHGIPAVLGTRTATSELRDGELVTVDGSDGRVLRPPKPAPDLDKSTNRTTEAHQQGGRK